MLAVSVVVAIVVATVVASVAVLSAASPVVVMAMVVK